MIFIDQRKLDLKKHIIFKIGFGYSRVYKSMIGFYVSFLIHITRYILLLTQ